MHEPIKFRRNSISASFSGDVEKMREWVKAGGDVSERNFRDGTALMTASAKGHLPMLDFLLEAGAELDAQRSNGRTALMSCGQERFFKRGELKAIECARLLWEAGADLYLRDAEGCLAEQVAENSGQRVLAAAIRAERERRELVADVDHARPGAGSLRV